jgi:hypothetical protein
MDWDWTERRFRVALVVSVVLAAGVVYAIGHEVFPYLSLNHDEGVYLQQASMLLHGKLWLTSDLPNVFQPWFFIQDGSRLYPKYTPVAALMFAPGLALGIPRLSLSVIAAGNVALIGLIGREAFDRPTGILASGFALVTPMFMFISATFMAYAPTMLLNLIFAFCYIRMHRRGGRRYAVIAGAAVGMSFFSRPYTAVLFAVPFVIHALVAVARDIRERDIRTPTIEREVVVALFGAGGVGIALAYNYVMTGSPFLFPYKVFAPMDGLGFGPHKLTGPTVNYTIELALRANKQLVVEILTRWTVAAPIGSVLAVIGLFPVALHYRENHEGTPFSDRTLRFVLIGVFITVIVGNIYFWGTNNILGGKEDPTNGFMAYLGPYYHLDLVLPLSVFAAAGVIWLGRVIGSSVSMRVSTRAARAVLIALLVVSVPIVATAEYNRVEPVVDRNMNYTEQYDEIYAPFENTTFEHALVFLPIPYDGWLGHPFQSLRNGGSLEKGDVLYAQNLGPAKQFETIDEFPNRTPYRFTYRGAWGSGKGQELVPHLQQLTVHNGTRHRLTTTVGDVGELTAVRLSAGNERVAEFNYYMDDGDTNGTVTVQWAINGTHVRLVDANGAQVTGTTTHRNPLTGRVVTLPTDANTSNAIAIDGPRYASLAITFTKPNGNTVTYRQGVAMDANNESVRFLWPGPTKLCLGSRFCGYEELYVPGGEYPDGISMNTTVRTDTDE